MNFKRRVEVPLLFAFILSINFAVCRKAPAATVEAASVEPFLSRPIIARQVPLQQVQSFLDARIPIVKTPATAAEWNAESARMRKEVLERVVYQGEAAKWRDAPLHVEWLERIQGGPGYHIKKLRYEALPGLWIPALLYEPDKIEGKVPVFLNVNGHDPEGKSAVYKQMRCINEAKRGIIALNLEWFGMGQFRTDGFAHHQMNQLDLCGTSGLAPFYLAMKRGLDVLLAHEHADPARVGVAGLSGGGWQTIIISSLDTRVTLSNPVAGYSTFRTRVDFQSDLGDSEQTPNDLGEIADYSHLTAMMAPRALLITFNSKDNCCFRADHALAPLLRAARPIFSLYGKDANLDFHINLDPGTHNFEIDNRQALYRFIGAHFYAGDRNFKTEEIESSAEIKTKEALNVDLPKDNADFQTLAAAAMRDLPRNAELPKDRKAAVAWQKAGRERLRNIVKAADFEVHAIEAGRETKNGFDAVYWQTGMGGEWTVPAVELSRGKPKSTTILIGDQGRAKLAGDAAMLLAKNERVIAVDPFYFGESHIDGRDNLFAFTVATVGERPLGLQAGQIDAVARWVKSIHPREAINLYAVGPRTSLIAVVAAALEPRAISSTALSGTMGSLKEIIESHGSADKTPELFCFGLLEAFDLKQLIALSAPSSVVIHEPSERAKKELGELENWRKIFTPTGHE